MRAIAAIRTTQTKAINQRYETEPDGFANGISIEKNVNLCCVSRATAYREFNALCEMGVLVLTGVGGRRYRLNAQRQDFEKTHQAVLMRCSIL